MVTDEEKNILKPECLYTYKCTSIGYIWIYIYIYVYI